MSSDAFTPHHMNVRTQDVAGNDGLGRYIFLPGSDGRAQEIAEHFDDMNVREHSRRHNFYMGTIDSKEGPVDVASISTGMGTSSVDIIMNELYRLGARRFLRVGTSGSLQPGRISIGAVVIANAAVRDEHTTACYLPEGVPAVASPNMTEAARRACERSGVEEYYSGTVHSKASLYARELGAGPLQEENRRYMEMLTESGVLASEMECSILFSLATIFSQELRSERKSNESGENAHSNGLAANESGENAHSNGLAANESGVEAGALLSIIGDETAFGSGDQIKAAERRAISVGLETVRMRELMRRRSEELR